MPKFKKKPVIVEAVQFTGDKEPVIELMRLMNEGQEFSFNVESLTSCNANDVMILTLEGVMTANIGDWIIKGVNGEFYPCKPDIFEKTYEAVKPGGELLTFGQAIEAAKAGSKVARKGWNGKGMWVIYNAGSQGQTHSMFEGSVYKNHGVDTCEILPHLDMYTVNADGRRAMLAGWLASQTDMISEDWVIV
ncbi:DUF2829 domain-containing protein [Shewanella sp. T24-MNA-CIBAN-0130]|uniref:DUF2829 domain-containing protein n=1 Tax=Shewanella sp. T24-MNA-CIBAN-0130 TaxID=3140470 RepID=UPI0033168C16